MTKQLTIDEMLDCLMLLEMPEYAEFKSRAEALGTELAQTLGKRLNVEVGKATFEGTAFAGTCVPFMPSHSGQKCPYPLDQYDVDEWEDNED